MVVERLDVAVVVDAGERVVRHPELLALVDVRRPTVQVQDRAEERGRAHPPLAVVAEAGDRAGLVVVVPVERVPADLGQAGLPPRQHRLEVREPQRHHVPLGEGVVDVHVLEGEHHVDLAPLGIGVELRLRDRGPGHLADGEDRAVAALHDLAVHLGEELVDPRAVHDVRRPVAEDACPHDAVGEARVLGDEVDDVHPEAVDAAVEPPAHHRVDRLAHLGVLPVEVRLLAREEVQVVLPARFVEGPRRPGEEALPVGRLGAGGAGGHPLAGRAPPVPVALRVVGGRARLHEPRVLVAGVVDDEVHHQPHPARVQGLEELVEVGQGAERRVDVLVVTDVVARVVLRGRIDRGEPHDVDAELLEVVEAADQSAEVADAVAVGVGEAAGVDLVDDRGAPPVVAHRPVLSRCTSVTVSGRRRGIQ